MNEMNELTRRLWRGVGYEPHDKQVEYHKSKARFRIPASGRRFGKSEMTEKDWLPELFDTERPGRYWMVALSYDTCDEFQYLWDDIVVKLGLGDAPGMKKANNVRTGEMFIELPWGTRVDVKSIKQPTTLVGKGLKRVLLSEAAKMPPIIFRKYIRPALADWRGGCDMPSTPEGFNWYYEEFLKGQGAEGDYESWNFPSWENKALFPGGFDDPEIQAMLPKDSKGNPIDDPWFWQEIGAEFRTMAGLIYPEFNRRVHVKPLEYDPELPNYLGFDWGFTHPLVALDIQVTPSDEVRVWREYVEPGQPVHVHAEELKRRESPEKYAIRCGYGDAADPDAVETMGRKLTRTVARTEAKDVKAGIRLVKSFLRSSAGPKLFVDPSCVTLIREFESYRMKVSRAAITNADVEVKDEPLKKNDDTLDALRYVLMHLYKLGGAQSLDDLAPLWAPDGERGGMFRMKDDEGFTMNEGITTRTVM